MAKRTYEQSLTFFKRNTMNRGNGRELYKTPNYLIERIVEDLLIYNPMLREYRWVDPCAGDGRWATVIKSKGINCDSYDIKPLNSSVQQLDFLMFKNFAPNLFFIGNPPFSLSKVFINNAINNNCPCYFLGGSMALTGDISRHATLIHRFTGAEGNQTDKRSKAIFEDTLGKNVIIWCCGGLYIPSSCLPLERYDNFNNNTFRVAIKKFCKEDIRVRKIDASNNK